MPGDAVPIKQCITTTKVQSNVSENIHLSEVYVMLHTGDFILFNSHILFNYIINFFFLCSTNTWRHIVDNLATISELAVSKMTH